MLGTTLTREAEANARRRIAWRLLPFLFVLFVIAFLDRVNVSYAGLDMVRDLSFSDRVFGLGSGIFFVGYLIFEIPGCLIVERWSARKWFARIMITWGLVTVLMAFIKTPFHFYLVRILLGAAEAGFFPGIIVYLSHWFRAEDRAKAAAIFMLAIPVSNIIGSPLSGWLLGVHWSGLQGWRWLFIVEGIPAIVFGVITVFYLTDWPREALWLSKDEREWIVAELERESLAKKNVRSYGAWEALLQPTVIQLTIIYFCAVSCTYALTIWLPTFVKRSGGMSDFAVTLLSIVPYVALLIAIVVNGWHSDRTGERRWHAVAPLILSTGAFAATILAGGHFWFAFGCLTLANTANAFLPAFWAIPYTFLGESGAAASTGLINSIGNLGGLVAPWMLGYFLDRMHSFTPGFLYVIASLVVAIFLTLRLPKQPIAERARA
ncbi:MAG TPA: MFS transporter [Candidatus Methylomirabilis sp.]|nr:MFS transporter [Candidatus Methylomirabilis sp.]